MKDAKRNYVWDKGWCSTLVDSTVVLKLFEIAYHLMFF